MRSSAKGKKHIPIALTLVCGGVIPVLCAIWLGRNFPDWQLVQEPLHATIEGLGAFAAICIATLILMMRESLNLRAAYIWPASGLVAMGVLGGFHAAHTSGEQFVWLHSLATFTGGLFFALIWLPDTSAKGWLGQKMPFLVLIVTLLIGVLAVSGISFIPEMISEGEFTLVARSLNVIGGLGFLGAVVYFLRENYDGSPGNGTVFSIHALLFGLAGLVFEFSGLWDALWWLWHTLRLAAYLAAVFFFYATLKTMKRSLEENKERFQNLVETTSDWIWELDKDANFTYVSPRVKTLLGYDPEKLMGTSGYDLMPKEEAERISRKFNAYVEKNAPFSALENINVRADGTRVVLESSGMPFFDKDGNLKGYRGIDRNITARKELESQLIDAKNAAEKANMDKSRFLAAASHDLRQPIHAMRLLTAAIGTSLSNSANYKIVQKLEQSIDNLAELLNTLLDISKLDAGVVTVELTEFPISQILQSAKESFSDKANQKGVKLSIVPCSRYVKSDPVLLRRIIDNLVSNAVRYTNKGRILIGCRKKGNALRIDVIDTGQGIGPEYHDIIFEDFLQLENPARQREQGLGLGLAIVKRTAHLLGHRLEVSSKLKKGSRFSIEVPVSQPFIDKGNDVQETNDDNPDVKKRQTVLIVEDDLAVLEATNFLLTAWGYKAVSAQSLEDAKRALFESRCSPDILIADYNLSGEQNGLDVYLELTNLFERCIPTILVSGDTSPERLEGFKESGLQYMSKPIDPMELKKELEKYSVD